MSEQFKAMKAVYCYPYPEVWNIISQTESVLYNIDSRPLFMTQTPVAKARKILKPLNLKPELDLPQTVDGNINLDMLHFPVLERDVAAYRKVIPALKEFPYTYPTAGSSEAIYHMLAEVGKTGRKSFYVPKGEYEGYGEYGKELKLAKNEIDWVKEEPAKQEPGVYFISNPSARDGNIIPNEKIIGIAEAGHRILLDMAFVGSTGDYVFDVSHPNITEVFLSWSKPYGMFRFRVGALFSRGPVNSLYGNKWFKDDGRMLLGLKVAEEIGPHKLYPLYQGIQEQIINDINRQFGLGIRRSDALLLGHIKQEDVGKLDSGQRQLIEPFRRGNGYRFCLEPYYELAKSRT